MYQGGSWGIRHPGTAPIMNMNMGIPMGMNMGMPMGMERENTLHSLVGGNVGNTNYY